MPLRVYVRKVSTFLRTFPRPLQAASLYPETESVCHSWRTHSLLRYYQGLGTKETITHWKTLSTAFSTKRPLQGRRKLCKQSTLKWLYESLDRESKSLVSIFANRSFSMSKNSNIAPRQGGNETKEINCSSLNLDVSSFVFIPSSLGAKFEF